MAQPPGDDQRKMSRDLGVGYPEMGLDVRAAAT